MEAFITGVGAYLPNDPVTNEEIEKVLGLVNGRPSRLKKIILKRNGINTRYYARKAETGVPTHTNAQLTAAAVANMADQIDFSLKDMDLLACGTSSPDQIIPSHAAMVHGNLDCRPCEVASAAGVCCSGMTAMKYAYMGVRSGTARHAVATGSELASSWLHAGAFPALPTTGTPEDDPYIAFEQEFLRWMLSDGAGAVAIEWKPRPKKPSLRIDWLDIISFANEMETCMYCGGVKKPDGTLQTWRELPSFDTAWQDGYLNLSQDVKMLRENIIPVGFKRSFERVIRKYELDPVKIDWFLPHLSSEFFRQPSYDMLVDMNFELPKDKWFTNLSTKGNTGAASIYIMLEELWASGSLKPGQRLLFGIPESARFTFAYMHCTVV